MTVIYLPNNLHVTITIKNNTDNIEIDLKWNKPLNKLPFPEDICDCMEEIVVHKNNLLVYLTKRLQFSCLNRNKLLTKCKRYLDLNKNELDTQNICGPTDPTLYHKYLEDAYKLLSNKKKDIHLALIEAIWQLWI